MTHLFVRRMTAGDELVANEVAQKFLGQRPSPESPIEHLLDDDRTTLIVALYEGSSIGFLLAYQFLSLSGERIAYLYDIEVDEAHRRSGVARAMVSLLQDICRAGGVRRIWVGTSGENHAACSLWEATGARRVSEQYVEFVDDLEGGQT